MQYHKFDLHMHSNCSDGCDTPEEVVQKCADAGMQLMALTDHDCTDGVARAGAAAQERDIRFLPAVEMDCEWPKEVHILGLDLDINHPRLTEALALARDRRIQRNAGILERLKDAGYDVEPYLKRTPGTVTRMHIGLALVDAGYAKNLAEAFKQYLRRGCPGFFATPRFAPEEVIDIIRTAGGVPVWAHPFHAGDNTYQLADKLVAEGLMGLEAYHPSASSGESDILVSIARQNKLLITCGSDSHGANRPTATIGCTWRKSAELERTFSYFLERT